jgi:voltage-gated potassium channel
MHQWLQSRERRVGETANVPPTVAFALEAIRTSSPMSEHATRRPLSLRNISPLLMMVALVFSLMVTPILEQRFHSRAFVYLGATMVLVIGVFVNSRRQVLFVPTLMLAALTIFVTWSTLVADYAPLFVISCLLAASFYAVVAGIMMILVLRRHLATVQSVFGAVCTYLLLGLSWSELYWAAARLNDEAFCFPPYVSASNIQAAEHEKSLPAFSDMVYFSFVTMSTLGYGDIRPQTSGARTLAWMQSVLGQFYLAVLVAWIVNSIGGWSKESQQDAEVDSS